ncbi:MAG TPA: hypothetical protein VFE78_33250, partial [Gemmataceae bacterium]|nr:hypothetical protein [Gemmataceae bacterium]
MKLDKETVVKHQFWFMLGGFTLLWIVALSTLKLMASGPIAAKRAAYDKAVTDVKGAQAKKPKNPATFLPPWEEHAKLFRSKRDTIWEAAFRLQNPEGQQPFETWPNVGGMSRLFYPDDLMDLRDIEEFKTHSYIDQFNDIDKTVAPTELAGGWAAIMTPQTWTKTPSREECWLAQEDLWVKSELLRVVKAVNDSVALFRPVEVKAGEKLPEGVPAGTKHLRFRNYNWQMDLFIGKVKDRTMKERLGLLPASKLTNVHPARRTLSLSTKAGEPISFFLRQGQAAPYRLQVNGESVVPDASQEFKKGYVPDAIDLNGAFDVEEAFEWETCPVKRIDAIKAPYQSHRTYTMTLKIKEALKKLDPEPVAPGAENADPNATPGAPGGAGGEPMGGRMGMGGSGGMKMGGMPGMPGAGAGGSGGSGQPPDLTSRNGIDRVRYLNVTDQCRHLPFGMVLVVDQAHIPDVELALANSRLRIQTTQVEFH